MQFKPKHDEDYRYWELAVAARGQSPERAAEIWSHWTHPDPIMHGPPQCGYYVVRRKGRRIPVALYYSVADEMLALIGRTDLQGDAQRIWDWCGRAPISYEEYKYWEEHGRFADEVEVAAPEYDHNAEDPGADFRDQLIDLVGKVEKFIASAGPVITDDAIAGQLANYREMLSLAHKGAELHLKDEITGMQQQIAHRRELWAPPIDAVEEVMGKIKALLTPWMQAQKDAGRPTKVGGQSGRRMSLRTHWTARIDDWDAALEFFKGNPKVRQLVQQLANEFARSRRGVEIEGVTYVEEGRAA